MNFNVPNICVLQASERDSPDLPDSTATVDKAEPPRPSGKPPSHSSHEESMDFDIDDIDKELELALERKRVRI